MPTNVRSLVRHARPDIRINLTATNKIYTTLDHVEGVVTVTAPEDMPFHSLDIEFAGSSRTFVERMTTSAAISGRSEAYHQFLKLVQPGLQHLYPEDHVLRKAETYEFPFVFAIPPQLLPRICRHPVVSETVRDAHLCLPPTIGDRDLLKHTDALDDFAPEMASIRYGIVVKLSEVKTRNDDAFHTIVAAKARRVCVVPAVGEQPPLDVPLDDDDEYVIRKEKAIRKNMLLSKTGTLIVEAQQPVAIQVSSYNNPEAQYDTLAHIFLRFDPADERPQPPKLSSVMSKLKVSTYFGCGARRCFPSKIVTYKDMSQGVYSTTINLATWSMPGVEWKEGNSRHVSENPTPCRDSVISTVSFEDPKILEPSSSFNGGTFYSAHIIVPITLPAGRAFPPTFHSCLISRIYTLKLDLSFDKAALIRSLDLRLPIQISSEGLVGDHFGRAGSSDDSVEVEIDGEDSGFFPPMPVNTIDEFQLNRSWVGSETLVDPPNGIDDSMELIRAAPTGPVEDAPPGYDSVFRGTTGARLMAHAHVPIVRPLEHAWQSRVPLH